MNREHYSILHSGVEKWNQWRLEYPNVRPDLWNANLTDADLRGANLTGAYLWNADLTGADLRSADLRDADLTGADLRGANLSGANLSGADLRWANLSDADLTGADITDAIFAGCTGDGRAIKSLQTDCWPVAYSAEAMQIGCQRHAITDWWGFSDGEIEAMATGALEWWRKWKPILRQIIEISPAVPTKQEDK